MPGTAPTVLSSSHLLAYCDRCLPYSTASVLMAEALVNVVIGYAAIRPLDASTVQPATPATTRRLRNKQHSLRKLVDWKSHKEFLGLTVAFASGPHLIRGPCSGLRLPSCL